MAEGGSGASGSAGGSTTYVQTAPVVLPKFFENQIANWFSTVEAVFDLSNVSSQDLKFKYLLTALPSSKLEKIPPNVVAEQKYNVLKEAVLAQYEDTKPELFNRLINQTTMTGRPSHYLNELLSIASRLDVGEDLVKHQFLKALPNHISPALAVDDMPMQTLGKIADNLVAQIQPEKREVAYYVNNTNPSRLQKYGGPSNYQKKEKNNGISGNVPYGLRPYKPEQRQKICRAHIYFAENARTCKNWCKFPNKNGCKMQPNSRQSSPARQEN